jgi:uncharacterized protein
MELQKQYLNPHAILAYDPKFLKIGEHQYSDSLLVTSDELISPWQPLRAEKLSIHDFQSIDLNRFELVIIGDDALNFSAYQSLQIELSQRRIGCEVMNLGAACRTFNILLAEDRRVLALFRLDI